MASMLKKIVILNCLLALGFICRGQDDIDSLRKILNTKISNDTSKVDLLNQIAKAYEGTDANNTIFYASQAKSISETISYKRGIAMSCKIEGVGHYILGQYLETVDDWEKSRAYFDSIGDRNNISLILSNLGAVYTTNGDEAKSLDYYLQSLKVAEDINDTVRIIAAENNIGVLYMLKKNTYNKALQYFLDAMALSEKTKDKQNIGSTCVNLGELYFSMGDNTKALYYYNKSAKAFENTEDLSYTLNDIGKLYAAKGDFEMAKKYHDQAYAIAKKLSVQLDMSKSLLGLGYVYASQKDYANALASYQEAESIAEQLNSTNELKESYEGLAKAYASVNDYANAFKYQTLLTGIKDTIYNAATSKKLIGLQFDFDLQKKESQISLLNKDKKIQQQEIESQRLVRNGFIGGFTIMLLFAAVVFTQRNRIKKAKRRSDELLLNILPAETAEELKETGSAKAKSFDSVTVLFTDFKNFTITSEILTPEELVAEINYCYSEFDRIVSKYGIEKIKTIGDSYMCAGGLPVTNKTHPFDVVSAGLEMVKFIEENKNIRMQNGQPYFELRLGIHTGPVVAGIVGIKKFAYDIWGDTVNTASRMESSGGIGKVNISGFTYELVKDKFQCTYRGKIEAKNKGEIDMYFVEG